MISKSVLLQVVKKKWKCTKSKCGAPSVAVKFVLTMQLETSRLKIFSRCEKHLDDECVSLHELKQLVEETLKANQSNCSCENCRPKYDA